MRFVEDDHVAACCADGGVFRQPEASLFGGCWEAAGDLVDGCVLLVDMLRTCVDPVCLDLFRRCGCVHLQICCGSLDPVDVFPGRCSGLSSGCWMFPLCSAVFPWCPASVLPVDMSRQRG